MKKSTEIILLISVIVIAFVVIYFEIPSPTLPVSSNTNTPSAQTAPVVEIVDTTAGFTSYGAPDFHGTVQSNTAVPVTVDIAADIYDESGRVQLAHGDTEVGINPYAQSPFEVTIFRSGQFPENWEYRVYVEDVH
ncbi:hypothetical protein [Methanoregula sp.]|uniref:hypothetical protein n=1 Tax=Methanoregula sp. TaxID=2052170 RepID=UPI003C7123AB